MGFAALDDLECGRFGLFGRAVVMLEKLRMTTAATALRQNVWVIFIAVVLIRVVAYPVRWPLNHLKIMIAVHAEILETPKLDLSKCRRVGTLVLLLGLSEVFHLGKPAAHRVPYAVRIGALIEVRVDQPLPAGEIGGILGPRV